MNGKNHGAEKRSRHALYARLLLCAAQSERVGQRRCPSASNADDLANLVNFVALPSQLLRPLHLQVHTPRLGISLQFSVVFSLEKCGLHRH